MLLIFKNEQTDSAGNKFSELLFVQQKNPQAEQWTGKRLGAEGAQQKLGIRMSLNASAFKGFNVDFSKFDVVVEKSAFKGLKKCHWYIRCFQI